MGRSVSCGAVACQVKGDTGHIEKNFKKYFGNSKRPGVATRLPPRNFVGRQGRAAGGGLHWRPHRVLFRHSHDDTSCEWGRLEPRRLELYMNPIHGEKDETPQHSRQPNFHNHSRCGNQGVSVRCLLCIVLSYTPHLGAGLGCGLLKYAQALIG